jgi:hypothetical protein
LFLFYSEHCVGSELFGNENLEAKKAAVKVKNRTFFRLATEQTGAAAVGADSLGR